MARPSTEGRRPKYKNRANVGGDPEARIVGDSRLTERAGGLTRDGFVTVTESIRDRRGRAPAPSFDHARLAAVAEIDSPAGGAVDLLAARLAQHDAVRSACRRIHVVVPPAAHGITTVGARHVEDVLVGGAAAIVDVHLAEVDHAHPGRGN